MDHWKGFADFVALETAAGGPSPNLRLIEEAAQVVSGAEPIQRAWLAGCYAAIYNTPASVTIWLEMPLERVRAISLPALEVWLAEHRPGLPVHSNRLRTHGGHKRMARGLKAISAYVTSERWARAGDYDELWGQMADTPSVGRYFGIKFAGALAAVECTQHLQYDIRARGAKNGRRTLAALYPQDAKLLDLKSGGNGAAAVDLAEERAAEVKAWLEGEYGLDVGWFQLEALLCEYNQLCRGKRYPGSTSDGDGNALDKVTAHWGSGHGAVNVTQAARERVLPAFLVDTRKRKPLLPIFKDHGYVWSDALYEDSGDPSRPALRSPSLTDWEPLTRPEEVVPA